MTTNKSPTSVQRKAVMLHIKSVPDTHHVLIVRFEPASGFQWGYTGNAKLLQNPLLERFEHQHLVLGGSNPKRIEIQPVDFAFNYISDADMNRKTLEYAAEFVDSNNIPTLNHPLKVLGTARDRIYQRFSAIEGLTIPKTLRITPHHLSDVEQIIKSGDIMLPLIMRPAGGHDGEGMYLLETLEDLHQLERFAFDGRDYFLIEFHDYKSPDGYYRKYRLIWIAGQLIPRSIITGEVWKLHSHNMLSDAPQAILDEAVDFLETMQPLDQQAIEGIKELFREIGLDYAGVDFGIKQDGTVLVFEANPAMNSSRTSNDKFPLVDKYWKAIEERKIAMLEAMAERVTTGTSI